MGNKLPVSVCLVASNEGRRIGRALDGVKDWAGEIVVLLNHDVQDDTETVAQNCGARTFREPWKGFIGQKNSVLDKCTQPWVLNLDADEVLSDDLKREIHALLQSGSPAHDAYEFPRCTRYCGRWIRHGDWYPDRVQRLWRRGQARWTGLEPHARLEVRGTMGRLKSDLLHYTNDSIAHHLSKIAPYHADFIQQQIARGRPVNGFELVMRPAWRFFRAYILRCGFLDGWQGYYIARFNSFSTLTKYAMTLEARARLKASQP